VKPGSSPPSVPPEPPNRLVRALEFLSSVAAFIAVLSLLIGLRDSPVRPAPAPGAPPTLEGPSAGAEVCVLTTERGGTPLARARVRLYSETDAGEFLPVGEGLTEEHGEGCFARVPRGSLWVLADAAGRARASTHVVLDADRRLSLELPVAARLEVTVTDELGAPLPRATVLVTASDPLPYGALSNESGKVNFEWLSPAPFAVRVSAPGYESALRQGVTLDFTVALRRLSGIDVRVVNADGSAAGNANVLIAGSALWPARRAETDAVGLARIRGLSAGSYDLRADRGDDVSPALIGFELGRGAQETVTLRLERGRRVVALVTDGEGESPVVVPNADVVLVEGGLGSFPLHGRTGNDGTVRLGPIARGPATLAARATDFVGSPLVPVPDPLTDSVRVPLTRGATLRGDVVDAHDRPIPGASIEVVGTDRFGLPISESPFTNRFRAGHFEWTLSGPPGLIPAGELGVMPGPVPPIPPAGAVLVPPGGTLPTTAFSGMPEIAPWVTDGTGQFLARPITPGRVRALVRHPEYVEGASEVVTVGVGGEAKVKIVLLQGGSLEGRVVDERDFPVAGVEVNLVAERGTFERSTITATDGAFAFAAVPAAVIVSVTRPEDRARVGVRKRVTIAEGGRERVELVLPNPRDSVRIVVIGERDAPVELAEVRVTSLDPDSPRRSTLFTDEAGVAELPDALGLALRIVVEAPRFATLERSVEKAGEELRLRLDPGVQLSGRVTAVRGRQSVAGALVTLRFGSTRKSTLTDGDGMYRFSGVPETRVELSASHPDFAEASLSADVKRTGRLDRPFEVDALDLSEPGEVEGRVIDTNGQPVEGARVTLGLAPSFLPAGTLPSGVALSDPSGEFVLRGLKPGQHRLGALSPGVGRGHVDGVEVSAGRATRGITITLDERATDDEPLAQAGLAITLAERGSGSALEVVVAAVATGSEAERGGLQAGDVLLHVDGAALASMADARARISGRESSDVLLEIRREGAPLKLSVRREAVRR
jgi:hypothetical protein